MHPPVYFRQYCDCQGIAISYAFPKIKLAFKWNHCVLLSSWTNPQSAPQSSDKTRECEAFEIGPKEDSLNRQRTSVKTKSFSPHRRYALASVCFMCESCAVSESCFAGLCLASNCEASMPVDQLTLRTRICTVATGKKRRYAHARHCDAKL